MRLLLVEDEPDIQRFLMGSLEEAGYQVDAAPDARTAENLAVEGTYDILIVDLGLPDKDGISLILQLRQMGVRAPVLILSARRSVDDRVRGLEQGGDDYLTKPFALAELLARLRSSETAHPEMSPHGCVYSTWSWTCCGARPRGRGKFCN
jgi:two-component system copper resistance phosphate regulon response regulator CusR